MEEEGVQGILRVVGSAFAGAGTTALTEWLKRKHSEGLTREESEAIYRNEIATEKARLDIERAREGKARITDDFRVVDISDNKLEFPSREDWFEHENPLQAAFQASEQERKLEQVEEIVTLQEVNNIAYRHAGAIPLEERREVRELDPTWLKNWKDYAKKATYEDLKKLYAKILVRESVNEGNHSVQLLNILSQLTKEEANKLADLSEFYYAFLPKVSDNDLYSINNITVDDLIHFEDLGILNNSISLTGVGYSIESEGVLTSSNQEYGLLLRADEAVRVRLPGIGISRAGKELLRLASKDASVENPDIRKEVGKFIKESNKDKGLQVALVKIDKARFRNDEYPYFEIKEEL